MKLGYDTKSPNPTYFIQKGFRNGKKVSSKNIAKIGRHNELLAQGVADPLAYARDQVAEYNRLYGEGKVELSIKVDFTEKLTATTDIASKANLLNVGYFFLQQLYQSLRIKDFFADVQAKSRMTYDCDAINRFLTFARALDPASRLKTFDSLDAYYEKPPLNYHHMLHFLTVLNENYESYLEHLFEHSGNIVKRNTNVCYFDCTNYCFETECDDDEYIDEVTGEIMKGLRKYGASKDHKPNPLVQMGLFMDGNGIPISMCINSGSDNEQLCAVPLERQLVKMFRKKEFIYCADAGLGSLNIRRFNFMGGRAFVVTQSIKKLSGALQEAVFNDFDYRRLSDNAPITIKHMKEFDRFEDGNLNLYNDKAYKAFDAGKSVDLGLYEEKICKNGRIMMVKSQVFIPQKIIVTFSRKSMEYQRHIRNAQVERARKILATKNVEDVKKGAYDVRRFIKRTSVGKSGEKACDHYAIDQNAIDREEKYDGYYAIATNLDGDIRRILSINEGRYKIEDCFRILKTNFNARPVFLRNRKRIVAHFVVCYTALLIHRLLEIKLDMYGEHFTTLNILQTLQNMNVVNIEDIYYTAAYKASKVCTALNGAFGLCLDKKNYEPKELNRMIKKITR